MIDSRPKPRRFGEVAEQWQWDNLAKIIPAIEHLAGIREGYKGPKGFWFTLPRGSDKTSSIARICNWCLAFASRYMRIGVAAADGQQAGLMRNAMLTEQRLNPWLGVINIQARFASGPGGELVIHSSDAGSIYGLNDDVYICDELAKWESEALWTAIYSGVIKRSDCVCIVITNAGYEGTWQHRLYSTVRADPGWVVIEASGIVAGWVDPERIAQVRKTLPAIEATRLFDNVWVSSNANYIFGPETIETMTGADNPLQLPELDPLP